MQGACVCEAEAGAQSDLKGEMGSCAGWSAWASGAKPALMER